MLVETSWVRRLPTLSGLPPDALGGFLDAIRAELTAEDSIDNSIDDPTLAAQPAAPQPAAAAVPPPAGSPSAGGDGQPAEAETAQSESPGSGGEPSGLADAEVRMARAGRQLAAGDYAEAAAEYEALLGGRDPAGVPGVGASSSFVLAAACPFVASIRPHFAC